MQVFLSFSHEDLEVARKLQQALHRRNIQTSSTLDTPPGEFWSSEIERASSSADAVVFLLESGPFVSPQLQAEWQAILRNDWDSTKLMIPLLIHDQPPSQLPRFLMNRRPMVGTNFDQLAERLEHLIQNPNETRVSGISDKNKAEYNERLENLKTFAEKLKSGEEQNGSKIGL